jgi:hypothetical protein
VENSGYQNLSHQDFRQPTARTGAAPESGIATREDGAADIPDWVFGATGGEKWGCSLRHAFRFLERFQVLA